MTNPDLLPPSLPQASDSELPHAHSHPHSHHHSLIHRRHRHRRHSPSHSHHHHRFLRSSRFSADSVDPDPTPDSAAYSHQLSQEAGSQSWAAAAAAAAAHQFVEQSLEQPLAHQPQLPPSKDASQLETPDVDDLGHQDASDDDKDADHDDDDATVTGAATSPRRNNDASRDPTDPDIPLDPAVHHRNVAEPSKALHHNAAGVPVTDPKAPAAAPAAALDTSSGPATSPKTGATSDPATTDAPTATSSSDSASSSQSPGPTSTPLPLPSTFPTIGDLHNGTNSLLNGNSSFVSAQSASSASSDTVLPLTSSLSSSSRTSLHRFVAASPPTILPHKKTSATDRDGDGDIDSDSSSLSSNSHSSDNHESTTLSASSPSSTSFSDSTPTPIDDGNGDADAAAPLIPVAAQPSPSRGANDGSGGARELEPHKVRIIGGVCGSVAGVAFLAVLVLLAIKFKKRRDARITARGGRLGSTASGTLTGGDLAAMAQRQGGPLALPLPPSTLARTGDARNGSGSSVDEGGERSFYRVAGRKLTPVLVTGGDGYSDPRESTLSGSSDYYRGSQAFDVATAGGGSAHQLALGAPMRPISGVPIMRSGPARTPVTENPFLDPASPRGPHDAPGRRPGSRASASKFHEGI